MPGTRYVALLRGINVGGNHLVKMARLIKLLEGEGFSDVVTLLASGNAVFTAPKADPAKLAARLEKLFKTEFGFDIPTVVRDVAGIRRVVAAAPAKWATDKEQRTEVLFLWDKYDSRKTLALLEPTDGVDDLLYAPGAIIWHLERKDYSRSSMHDLIGTDVYKHMTMRNVNTVRKILALMEQKSTG